MTNQKTKKSNVFYLLGIVFITLWLNTGVYLQVRSVIPSILPYFCFGILLLCWLATDLNYRVQWMRICLPIVAFYIVAVLNYYVIGNRELFPAQILYLLIALSIGLYCFGLSRSAHRVILLVFLLDYLFISINSWRILSQYPELSRFLAAGPEKMAQYKSMGLIAKGVNTSTIGSYGFFNSLIFVSMVFFVMALRDKSVVKKILFFCVGVLTILLIVKGAFTTALIMVFVGLILVILSNHIKSSFGLTFVLFAIFLFLLLSGALANLFLSLSNLDALSEATRVRFYEIYSALTDHARDASSISGRTILYRDSFLSFLISPIGGHMLWGNYEIGQHSSFFDYFGMYGMFACLLLVGLYRFMKTEIQYVEMQRRAIQAMWAVFLLTSFINPVFIQNIFVALFVFVPCALNQIESKSQRDSLAEKNEM